MPRYSNLNLNTKAKYLAYFIKTLGRKRRAMASFPPWLRPCVNKPFVPMQQRRRPNGPTYNRRTKQLVQATQVDHRTSLILHQLSVYSLKRLPWKCRKKKAICTTTTTLSSLFIRHQSVFDFPQLSYLILPSFLARKCLIKACFISRMYM